MNQAEYQDQLTQDIAAFAQDPLGFACFAFPWGQGELSDSPGPRKWQAEVLSEITRQLSVGKVCRIVVASGHDIGKTCLTAFIQLWALSTMPGTKGQCTANTGQQLKTKTWSELAKWNRLSINSDWFEVTATSIYTTQEKYKLEWRSDMAIWRENRTEAFAGFHNYGKRILILVDEASGIPQPIWDTIEGFFLDKDTEIICLAFGNPLQNSGGFYEIFREEERRKQENLQPIWKTFNIDSREVEGVNLDEIDKMIEIHGEDSDFVKTRVRGLFPNASSTQFIPTQLCWEARKRTPTALVVDPLVCGIDFAMSGTANCVFYFRRGLDGKTIPPIILPGKEIHDATHLADLACEILATHKPDMVFGDKGSMGGPVMDIMRRLGYNVIPVNFGGEPTDKLRYYNKSAEMAMAKKQWLYDGGAIWDDPKIQDDMCQREYGQTLKGQLKLETKEDMKKRGLESPDVDDALNLTFAHPVAPKGIFSGIVHTMKTTLDSFAIPMRKHGVPH